MVQKPRDELFLRSIATRRAHRATSEALMGSIKACSEAEFDLVIVETAGVGQSDTEIADLVDVTLYVMTSDYGAATQLEKIGMLDVADFVVLNKYDHRGSMDALRDVRKQVQRNRMAFDQAPDTMPVYPTTASRFHDPGVTALYMDLVAMLREKYNFQYTTSMDGRPVSPNSETIIPARRQRYLGEICDSIRDYHDWVRSQVNCARKWGQVRGTKDQVEAWNPADAEKLCHAP